MKNTVILICGAPGTGKTHCACNLVTAFPDMRLYSPDSYKEKYWDLYGFDDKKEKDKVSELAWTTYFEDVHEAMEKKVNIIADYPFSYKHDYFRMLQKKYSAYLFLTVTLIADPPVLYDRARRRDLNPMRHLGHLVDAYHKGQDDFEREKLLMPYEAFNERNLSSGYNDYFIGEQLVINVTEFNPEDDKKIVGWIKTKAERE